MSPNGTTRCYWANYDLLNEADRSLIEEPEGYSTRMAALLDMAYQAWLKGIIVDDKAALRTSNIRPDRRDEYRFIRRHFNAFWSLYMLAIRLAELNNPIAEVIAFISSIRVKRINPYTRTKDWRKELQAHRSKLLDEEPKVSVVIPTLNRYGCLQDVLRDLEKQVYKNFEVLVVDQSDQFDREVYKPFELDIKVWNQKEKALWLARNTAIQKSIGEFVLLLDDDSRVGESWIRDHIKCLDFFQADISSGVSISAVGAKVPETYSHYKWGDQIDTGNVMLRKQIFREIGLFDRQFEKQRQGDGEFGLRAYLAGYANISNPDALRQHLKVAKGGLREMGSWDAWRPIRFFAPRPMPSVLYFIRRYFGTRAAVYQILQSVLPSIVPYRFKRSRILLLAGCLLSVFLGPLIGGSVVKSWRLASRKLEEGPKIPQLVE